MLLPLDPFSVVQIPNVNEETGLLLSATPDRIGHGTFLTSNLGGTADNVELIRSRRIPIGQLLLAGWYHACTNLDSTFFL